MRHLTMHELSIALSIVELAEEEAAERSVRVNAVHLKLGRLSGVVRDAISIRQTPSKSFRNRG